MITELRSNTIKALVRDHPFSVCAKFSEKLTGLTPDTHTYVCVSGGKKC